ncbi:MAG: thioredoxin family protein [Bacilli bacterium]|nr:thioredoxin family protein [Bacilli bacterium]
MKKIILIILSCFILTACTNTDYTKAQYEDISYEDFMEKVNNNETFIIFLYQTGCTHCEAFEPKLNEVISNYDLTIYALNLIDLTDEEYAKVENKTFVAGTPTTVYFKEGKKVSKLVGDKDKEDLIKFLVDANYIEEG